MASVSLQLLQVVNGYGGALYLCLKIGGRELGAGRVCLHSVAGVRVGSASAWAKACAAPHGQPRQESGGQGCDPCGGLAAVPVLFAALSCFPRRLSTSSKRPLSESPLYHGVELGEGLRHLILTHPLSPPFPVVRGLLAASRAELLAAVFVLRAASGGDGRQESAQGFRRGRELFKVGHPSFAPFCAQGPLQHRPVSPTSAGCLIYRFPPFWVALEAGVQVQLPGVPP